MYKFLFLIAAVQSANLHSSIDKEFELFTQQYGKEYPSSEERTKRLEIFKQNFEMIEAVNNDPNSQETLRLNAFADLTDDEFRQRYRNGYVPPFAPEAPVQSGARSNIRISDLPKEVDWRKKNVMTPVKNQGFCGDCWAYASTEVLETQAYINSNLSGPVPVLSAPMLTDCAPNPLECGGSGGCQGGGAATVAYSYSNLFGLPLDKDYRHSASEDKCFYNWKLKIAVSNTGYNVLPSNQIESVMAYLAFKGPITVVVDAHGWQQFHSGDSLLKCPAPKGDVDLDHLAVLVGYGSDAKRGDYWIIRNSWGSGWGDQGYAYMKRDTECGTWTGSTCRGKPVGPIAVCGACGVLFQAVHPIGSYYLD